MLGILVLAHDETHLKCRDSRFSKLRKIFRARQVGFLATATRFLDKLS